MNLSLCRKDLTMARLELFNELKIREKELIDELEAIRKIIYSNTQPHTPEPKITNQSALWPPKGNTPWLEYTEKMLQAIGKGKTEEVLNAVISANPSLDKQRAKSAVRHHLSKLYRDGRIDAKAGIKSKGYTYITKRNNGL